MSKLELKRWKPTVLDSGSSDYDDGYAAGLRDGAARERRALRRYIGNLERNGWSYEYLFAWLSSRKGKK